jgi:hypothetical protein
MDVELLVVPDCPSEAPAAALLRSALTLAGLTSERFVVTVIADQQAASRRGFAGSPTFLINGSDPFVGSEQPSGLTCRLYRRPDGRASGLPDPRDLRDALNTAARADAPAAKPNHG